MTTYAIDTQAPDEAEVEAFVERVFASVLATQEIQAAYIGDRLGWYEALERDALTAPELAARTSTSERYAREWLEHQTVTGWLTCENPEASPTERRFALPAAHAEALVRPDSLAHMGAFARFIGGLGKNLDALVDAYRNDTGVSWEAMGEDAREGQAGANRPMFVNQLAQEYLASIPDVDAALRNGGRVADVGAGLAWSSVGVAKAYPRARVDAFDIDEPSIESARRIIAEAGLGDRVTATAVDVADLDPGEPYDLVMALECIHDLPDPVSVLGAMHRLAGDDGAVIVMDERVADEFTAEADEVERLLYGFSITCCLPDSKAHHGSVATGTVMRRSTLERYAHDAGFTSVVTLPIENDFFRFYRLH
jgi:cyclopropane fatty-acyl-phospholipid synthase-like methyltransferase